MSAHPTDPSKAPTRKALDGFDKARALAVETLVEAAEMASAGKPCTITVTVEDERGGIAYRDRVEVGTRSPDDAAVGRAIGVMGRGN